MNIIQIWYPKYSTQDILIDPRKIREGKNYVEITKDSNYKDVYLEFDSDYIYKYPIGTNGKINVLYVPIREFTKINK